MQNYIPSLKEIPIPFEQTFFSQDAIHEPNSNRYIFSYPEEWVTSNIGERIIGVRGIYDVKIRRKLEFKLGLLKWKKDQNGNLIEGTQNTITIDVICWQSIEDDFRNVYLDISKLLNVAIENNNKQLDDEEISHSDDKDYIKKVRFNLCDRTSYYTDFQMDGNPTINPKTHIYTFTEIMFCPNYNINEECRFAIYDLNDNARAVFNVKDPLDPNDKNTNEEVSFDSPVIKKYWYDVWDRHSCKIYASFCESHNKYLGNSKVLFEPLKYYKLKSTDKTFWVDLYNSREHKTQTVLPNDNREGFYIDMVFMRYDKLMYI